LRQLILWEQGDEFWYGRGLPRAWLEDGREVRLDNAPTRHGLTGFHLASQVGNHRIHAEIRLPARTLPRAAWLRLRHPRGLAPRQVTVNQEAIRNGDVRGEDIRLPLVGRQPGDVLRIAAVYAP
jgi:hypothetical protein